MIWSVEYFFLIFEQTLKGQEILFKTSHFRTLLEVEIKPQNCRSADDTEATFPLATAHWGSSYPLQARNESPRLPSLDCHTLSPPHLCHRHGEGSGGEGGHSGGQSALFAVSPSGKLLNLLVPQSLHLKNGDNVVLTVCVGYKKR